MGYDPSEPRDKIGEWTDGGGGGSGSGTGITNGKKRGFAPTKVVEVGQERASAGVRDEGQPVVGGGYENKHAIEGMDSAMDYYQSGRIPYNVPVSARESYIQTMRNALKAQTGRPARAKGDYDPFAHRTAKQVDAYIARMRRLDREDRASGNVWSGDPTDMSQGRTLPPYKRIQNGKLEAVLPRPSQRALVKPPAHHRASEIRGITHKRG